MNAKKKKKKDNLFGAFIVIIILPLLLVNIFAGWKVLKVAESLEIPLLGSVDDGPAQLAALLFINCMVLTLLTISRRK